MAEISWDKKYCIDIKNIDAHTAWHLRSAINKYMATNPFADQGDEDTKAELEELIDICDNIQDDEERD